jgi:formamidopyrimidine-DNA glycosylase
MPELPEVETVRRSLEPALYEGTVVELATSGLPLRQRAVDAAGLERALVGARFVAARRHGKYLLLDTDRRDTLVVHLGMAGRLLLGDADAPSPKHTHVRLALSSGKALRFVDPRRFGTVRLYEGEALGRASELASLGPDPLAEGFAVEILAAGLSRTRRDLKTALLDQRLIAGLGNIYVSEALFEARLSPRRRAHTLRRAEITALHRAIVAVLRRGVRNRGTSFSDYVDADGRSGDNQRRLWVYGRTGEPCRRCGTRIRQFVQAARSTFHCPTCQAAGRKRA